VDRAAHGRALSRTYLDIADGYTRNHLLQTRGEYRLRDFTARNLDSWTVALHREAALEPATINKLLQTLRMILGQAVLMAGSVTTLPATHGRCE
jgi:hypothetical protein